MSEAVKIRISPVVGAFVKPGATSVEKMFGIDNAPAMGAADRVVLLFCLTRDGDPIVKTAAREAFEALPSACLLEYASQAEAHPAILELIVRIHGAKPDIAALGRQLQAQTVQVQQEKELYQPEPQPAEPQAGVVEELPDTDRLESLTEAEEAVDAVPPEETEEGDSDYLSKYQMVQMMGISEKIKMALTGDKEWRSILIKDANKLVSGSVIKNPRITDGEVLNIVKVGVQNDEIIRLICANRDWTKNYAIRKALLENPKTPLPNALRYLATMNDKDIAGYAKSKNISSVIATQAKRLLLSKKR